MSQQRKESAKFKKVVAENKRRLDQAVAEADAKAPPTELTRDAAILLVFQHYRDYQGQEPHRVPWLEMKKILVEKGVLEEDSQMSTEALREAVNGGMKKLLSGKNQFPVRDKLSLVFGRAQLSNAALSFQRQYLIEETQTPGSQRQLARKLRHFGFNPDIETAVAMATLPERSYISRNFNTGLKGIFREPITNLQCLSSRSLRNPLTVVAVGEQLEAGGAGSGSDSDSDSDDRTNLDLSNLPDPYQVNTRKESSRDIPPPQEPCRNHRGQTSKGKVLYQHDFMNGLSQFSGVAVRSHGSRSRSSKLKVCGVWCVVSGVWCVVCGAWCVVRGAWCVVHGVCGVV